MGMHETRTRVVRVEGHSYEVITGVAWASDKRYWVVTVSTNIDRKFWRFYAADYGNSVDAARKAAIEFAPIVRRDDADLTMFARTNIVLPNDDAA